MTSANRLKFRAVDGYSSLNSSEAFGTRVEDAHAASWGCGDARRGTASDTLTYFNPFVQVLMKHRLVQDFTAA